VKNVPSYFFQPCGFCAAPPSPFYGALGDPVPLADSLSLSVPFCISRFAFAPFFFGILFFNSDIGIFRFVRSRLLHFFAAPEEHFSTERPFKTCTPIFLASRISDCGLIPDEAPSPSASKASPGDRWYRPSYSYSSPLLTQINGGPFGFDTPDLWPCSALMP